MSGLCRMGRFFINRDAGYLDFLIQKSRKREGPQDVKRAVSAVEDTWGSIRLSREVLKFVAEDKELEYEV